LPQQGFHSARDVRLGKKRLAVLRIVADEIVEIFDLIAQRIVDSLWDRTCMRP
jgi:hypothetical protein